MTRHQNITVTEAIAVAKRKNIPMSRVTAIKYINKHKLGGQLDGKFSKVVVDAKKWGNFLNGSNKNKKTDS